MALYDLLYKITTGPMSARRILTPVGLIVFLAALGVIVGGGVLIDRLVGFARLLPRGPGLAAAVPLIALGAFLSGWSILIFLGERGTPVPFNPPPELVAKGPYAYSRNPMSAGLFLQLFGLGLLIGSVGLTLIMTPAFVAASVIGLKLVEEPELERRLGTAYVEYRRRTPMFLPKLGRPGPWRSEPPTAGAPAAGGPHPPHR
jgi:protein-S-isoprenylcysteine O-methyltransferase Ste14